MSAAEVLGITTDRKQDLICCPILAHAEGYTEETYFANEGGWNFARASFGEDRWPKNMPDPRRRDANTATMQDFYAALLTGPPGAPDEIAGPDDLGDAAGITDWCDVGIVVPLTKLPLLRLRFPGMAVRRYELTRTFWSYEAKSPVGVERSFDLLFPLCQTRYGKLIDATTDGELWDIGTTEGAMQGVLPPVVQQYPTVDVIIYVETQWAEEISMQLSRRVWADRQVDRASGDFVTAGTRLPAPPRDSLPIMLVVPGKGLFKNRKGLFKNPLGLPEEAEPVWGDLAAERAMQKANQLLHSLQVTGWLGQGGQGEEHGKGQEDAANPTGLAEYRRLVRFTRAEAEADLALAGQSHQHVFYTSPSWVLQQLVDGTEIESGAVALVDARGNHVAKLRLPEHLIHLNMFQSDADAFNKTASDVAAAHTVVFYCNHASSNSPMRAETYLDWLRAIGHPSKDFQKVRVLDGGMAALVHRASVVGGEALLDKLFVRYDSKYVARTK